MPSACAPSDADAALPRRVVVLGIGNTLLADEGVGVHAARALEQGFALPEGVEVIDGGTAGMELLGPLAGADLLLVLDAVKSGRAPAALVLLEGDEVPAFFRAKLSQHQVSICDVLAGLEFEGAAPRELLLVGVEPVSMELSLSLTPPVAARLPQMVDAAVRALAQRGVHLQPRALAVPRAA
jgi:hydrogenase maturation protease